MAGPPYGNRMAPDDELKFVEFFAPAYYVCDPSIYLACFIPRAGTIGLPPVPATIVGRDREVRAYAPLTHAGKEGERLIMAVAITLHVRRKESRAIGLTALLFLMAAFVACERTRRCSRTHLPSVSKRRSMGLTRDTLEGSPEMSVETREK